MGEGLGGRDLISLIDFSPTELRRLLSIASEIKANSVHYRDSLRGRTLFMYFEKPSLRTRVTFETGMTQLGGHAIYYTATEGRIGVRESIEDVARNLERWVDGAMCRTYSHQLLQDLARFSTIPIINGLTDQFHPCQALADFLTLSEVCDQLAGRTVTFVGDGRNNVARSLMFGSARLGLHLRLLHPPGFAADSQLLAIAERAAKQSGGTIQCGTELSLVDGADAVYTDAWASMGQEDEAAQRDEIFRPYQVNEALMERAAADALFMHCLPAHRGDEVTDAVADSPRSVIFQQAENRLHAQKAVLYALMAGA